MAVKIFFCYAHEDEELLKKLKAHLKPLQREGLIDVWYDREIRAGTEWEQVIKEQLNTAQIILLLVSPDFMASDYVNDVELKRALERHERGEAKVIPVILRPAYWQGAPFGKLQALPTDAKPVVGSSWRYRDEAFYNVEEGIRKVVRQLTTKMSATPTPVSPVRPTQWKSHSRYGAALLIVLALLVIGNLIYNSVKGSGAHMLITPTATAQGYDRFVATHGMMFGFDAAHTHFNPYERILTPENVSELKLAWTSPKMGFIVSSPTVVNGMVYVGSDDHKLYAFNAGGCEQLPCPPLWYATTGGKIRSSPVVVNGMVYVGSEDDKLYAFKAGGCKPSPCSPVWTATTGDQIDSSPVVVNGMIYVGSGDGSVYAFGLKQS